MGSARSETYAERDLAVNSGGVVGGLRRTANGSESCRLMSWPTRFEVNIVLKIAPALSRTFRRKSLLDNHLRHR
jgi:hypothetical protein